MLLRSYAPFPVTFVRGEGVRLFDDVGRSYLDFASGVAVTGLGHGDPVILGALSRQLEKIWHVSNFFHIASQERCADRLLSFSPFARGVFFCNSGAEANEAMLKLARRTHYIEGNGERYRTITFRDSFHGRTLSLIAASARAEHLEGFGPAVDGFDQVSLGDRSGLQSIIGDDTAAIMVEPIQGDGGMHVVELEELRYLRSLCDERGLLLLFDEIQSGCARTGKFWSHEWSGVSPDLLSSAKGLGNGIPVGAVLASERCAEAFSPGSHGSTYGGNTLAMEVVLATLGRFGERGFLERVVARGERLWSALCDLQRSCNDGVIAEVRGKGLMLGLKLRSGCVAQDFAKRALSAGLVVVPCSGNVVRLLPPLILSESDIDEGVSLLRSVCDEY